MVIMNNKPFINSSLFPFVPEEKVNMKWKGMSGIRNLELLGSWYMVLREDGLQFL